MSNLSESLKTYLPWAVLALPAAALLSSLTSGDPRALHHVSGEAGEWAARLLMLTLIVTPLTMIFRGGDFARWLRKARRHFGVAAFAYGVLHLGAYLGSETLARVLSDLTKVEYLAGWLAFLVFLPLAATSTDWAVRRMGTWWKPMQRLTYLAAAAVLLHWSLLHDGREIGAAFVTFAPWFGLSLYRMWYWYLRPRAQVA